MSFHVIASTGRTATTYIAATLDRSGDVAACHEGYRAALKDQEPLLPLVNLENNRAYQSESDANAVVATKRSDHQIEAAIAESGSSTLIDVAYYNCALALAILRARPASRIVAIIRDCEPFVRSSTSLNGEDPLPVGWPDPGKALTSRERFVGFGRLRPRRGSDAESLWSTWSAISRNIWLWRESNALLLNAKDLYPERVQLIDFKLLGKDEPQFWGLIASHFQLKAVPKPDREFESKFRNRNPSTYQIGLSGEWTDEERELLAAANSEIKFRMDQHG